MIIQISDPIIRKLHQRVEEQLGPFPSFKPARPNEYFESLVESVVSQQLSTKVADTIFGRVKALTAKDFSPQKLLAISIEDLRQAGLSYAKASYVQNIAKAWEEGLVEPQALKDLEDEAVIEQLVQIKGVGRWTAEMFLMFTLARPDIFSVGDYGLRQAVSRAYDLPATSQPSAFEQLAKRWSPHRTLASRILWKSLEL
ncbi:MAG TPA: DNA-3-methyladenine glycosylase [Patescibacteria group bacterium]|jgi:DNA-3-methyladenine glycosylase II